MFVRLDGDGRATLLSYLEGIARESKGSTSKLKELADDMKAMDIPKGLIDALISSKDLATFLASEPHIASSAASYL
jgi:hypothetical protein